jgi:DNA-binding TFAR19-related protein (PDSD5 family)
MPQDNSKDEELQKILEAKRAEQQLRASLRLALTDEAYERMMNVRISNPSLFSAVAEVLLATFRRVGRKLTDEEVLNILRRFTSMTRRESKIEIRRK